MKKLDPTATGPVIDLRNLDSIFNGYIVSPDLIKSFNIQETILDHRHYRNILKVFHAISDNSASTGKITIDQATDVIDSVSLSFEDADKTTLKTYFAAACKAAQPVDGTNCRYHYNIFQKEYALRSLYGLGYEIADFWPDDPANISPEQRKVAEKNYRNHSAEELCELVRDRETAPITTIQDNLAIKADIQIAKPDDLEGANDTITYLIARECDDDPMQTCGWMELGSFNSIIAPAKAGKTQLAMQTAFAVQNGFQFLGYDTLKGDVLYVDFELRAAEIGKRMKLLTELYKDVCPVESKGDTLEYSKTPYITKGEESKVDYPYFISASKSFSNGKINLDDIIRACRNFKLKNPNLKLIVFDCYYTFAEGDSNVEEDTKNTLLKLKSLVDDTISVCYVHHTNKQGAGRFNSTDMIYAGGGSGVHGKIVDNTYVIKPIEGTEIQFEIFTTGRANTGDSIPCARNKRTYHFFKPYELDHLYSENRRRIKEEAEKKIENQANANKIKKGLAGGKSELYQKIVDSGDEGYDYSTKSSKDKYGTFKKPAIEAMGFEIYYRKGGKKSYARVKPEVRLLLESFGD